MSSATQIEANRANALLSTGPKTEAGINACKFNASKHSLSGKQIVVAGESAADYESVRLELHEHHAPANPAEAMLVEEISQAWWRHERALRVEAQVLAKYGELECITEPEARKAFSLITRYGNSIERTLNRAAKELEKLQKARKKEEQQQAMATFMSTIPAKPAPVPTQTQPKNGSVSQPAKTRHPNEDLPLACRL